MDADGGSGFSVSMTTMTHRCDAYCFHAKPERWSNKKLAFWAVVTSALLAVTINPLFGVYSMLLWLLFMREGRRWI